MSSLRLRCASGVALFVGWIGRRLGTSGTSLPGKILLRLAPKAISGLSGQIPHGCIVVTATNGKTTTCRLASAALASGGLRPVHNSAGANMAGGIAACLVSSDSRTEQNAIGLFEVDEFWIPEVCTQVRPRLLLFGNLFRDQLDRYGELDSILDRWRACLPDLVDSGTRILLCADDPAVASLAEGIKPSSIIWFGIDDAGCGIGALPHSADAGNCRSCGAELVYDEVLLAHLGHWRCADCGLQRPNRDYSLTEVTLAGATTSRLVLVDRAGTPHSIELALPGVYNA